MPTTISFINQKGGCGKSSTCFHLSGYFAQAGFRVLLVDTDPQGSLSQGIFGSAAVENLTANETLAAVFEGSRFALPCHLVVSSPITRISIIRANQTLAMHNVPEPERTGLKQFALNQLLEGVADYDIVLIDCPPNLYQCSWNALLASDFVVVPVPPEDFGTQGLRAIHQAIESASILNPRLALLGHVVTRSDRRLIVHRMYEQRIRALYHEAVFTTVVPEASAFKVSLSCRRPVNLFSSASKAARVMMDLGQELLARIASTKAKRGVA